VPERWASKTQKMEMAHRPSSEGMRDGVSRGISGWKCQGVRGALPDYRWTRGLRVTVITVLRDHGSGSLIWRLFATEWRASQSDR
jgi:hypothetical protein